MNLKDKVLVVLWFGFLMAFFAIYFMLQFWFWGGIEFLTIAMMLIVASSLLLATGFSMLAGE